MKCPIIARTQYGVGKGVGKGVWKGVGKGGYGLFILDYLFSGFSFSVYMNFNPTFENQNGGRNKNTMKNFFCLKKQQNICFKLLDRILEMFTRTRILTRSCRWWENKVNIWHHDGASLWTFKRKYSNKDLKSNENGSLLWKIDTNAKYYCPEGFY